MATSHLIATTKAVTLFRVVTGDIEIAESHRIYRGLYWNTEARRHGEYIFKFSEDTECYIGTQRHRATESIFFKFSEGTESFLELRSSVPPFFSALPFSSALPFPSALYG